METLATEVKRGKAKRAELGHPALRVRPRSQARQKVQRWMNRRRPAAAGVGRRRPAAAIERVPVRGRRVVDPEEAYSQGEVVKAHQLPPTLLDRGHWIVSEASTYFGEECKWAGKVSRVTFEAGES